MSRRPVTLFTHSRCSESPKVRRWLAEHGISFVEKSLDEDRDVAEALQATGSFVVPLVVAGDQKIIGYSPERLKQLLEADTG